MRVYHYDGQQWTSNEVDVSEDPDQFLASMGFASSPFSLIGYPGLLVNGSLYESATDRGDFLVVWRMGVKYFAVVADNFHALLLLLDKLTPLVVVNASLQTAWERHQMTEREDDDGTEH